MNTADRSIALIDHALRRRFSFVFLEPHYEGLEQMLRTHGLDAIQLPEVLRQINTAIGDRHYHLGTSFFLSAGDQLMEELQEIWEGEIEPYLEEFFFDQPTKVDDFGGRSWFRASSVNGLSNRDTLRHAPDLPHSCRPLNSQKVATRPCRRLTCPSPWQLPCDGRRW